MNNVLSFVTNPVVQSWGAILVTCIVLVVTTFSFLIPTIERAEDSAAALQQSAALQAEHLLELNTEHIVAELRHLGRNLLTARDDADRKVMSQNFFDSFPEFMSFLIVDAHGKLIAESARDAGKGFVTGASVANTAYFQKALSGENYLSPVYISPSGPMIRVAVPAKNDTAVEWIISGELDISFLWQVVQLSGVPDGKIYVVDERGVIVSDKDASRSRTGESLKYREVVQKLLEESSLVSLVRYHNENGVDVVASGVRMKTTGWAIVAEQPTEVAFKQRSQTTQVATGFALASLALFLMLTIGTFRLTRANRELEKDKKTILGERNKSQQVISGMSDAVIAVDRERGIITLNPAAEKLTGLSFAAIKGSRIDTVLTILENGIAVPKEIYCPTGGAHSRRYQRKGLKLQVNKTESYVDVVANPLEIFEENDIGCIITLHDVTRERKLEELKSGFITIVAHQLRTPLTGIKWIFASALEKAFGNISTKQEEYFSAGLRTTDRLVDLVHSMLEVEKLESGTISLHIKPVSLRKLLVEMVHFAETRAIQKKLTLTLNEFDDMIVSVDITQTKNALQNLLDNAINYTPSGGSITVAVRKEGHFAVCQVIDTGIGIPKEEQGEVFRRFFRGSNASLAETTGTGLGIALVKSVIEKQGGHVGFTSQEGGGSTFFVTLPLSDDRVLPEPELAGGTGDRPNLGR